MGWHLNRWRVTIGLLGLICLGIFGGMFSADIRAKRGALTHAPALASADLSKLLPDDAVIVEGEISPLTKPVVGNLAVACEEVYWSDDEGSGWDVESETANTVMIRARPDLDVPVQIDEPCPEGERDLLQDPANTQRRWVGYAIGRPLTLIATVETVSPLKLQAEAHFAGTRAAYLADLQASRGANIVISGMLLLAGLLFTFWPGKQSKTDKRLQWERSEAAKRQANRPKPGSKPNSKQGSKPGSKPGLDKNPGQGPEQRPGKGGNKQP